MTSALTVPVVGCSGSFPGPHSAAWCYLIESVHEGRTTRVVIDLGNGALGALQQYVDPNDLDAIFITHLHPDHFIDLCGLYVLRRYHPTDAPTGRLPLYGPKRLFQHLQLAYYGKPVADDSEHFAIGRASDREAVEVGSLRVNPVRVKHPIEAYGYRIEGPGGTVAFTGDTDTCDALTPLLADADLALVDSAFVEGRDEVRGIHLTARRAAQAAIDAGGVRRLVLTHLPPWTDPEVSRAEAAELWPDVEVATAGARYSLSS